MFEFSSFLMLGLYLFLIFVIRELVCWYLKISDTLGHLESIDNSLKILVKQSSIKKSTETQ